MAKAKGPGKTSGPSLFQGIGLRMRGIGLIAGGIGFTGFVIGTGYSIAGCGIPAFLDPRDMLTLAGIGFAIFAFAYNANERLEQSRKQHTIKLLFDTRLSSEFRSHLENRRRHFPLGDVVNPATYRAHLDSKRSEALSEQDADSRRKSAEALRSLLNYYEFVAFGIRNNEMDETLLRNTIRSIMCHLVQDARLVIEEEQKTSNTHYEHLAWLYDRWREDRFEPIAAPKTTG